MIGGVDLSQLGRNGTGQSRLVVTPERAQLNLRQGMTPDGHRAVFIVTQIEGWPLDLVIPIPVPAWQQLLKGLGDVEASG